MNSSTTAEAAAYDTPLPMPSHLSLVEVQALLTYTTPFCSELDRESVIASVHRITGGSDVGLASLLVWYEKRPDYPGMEAAKRQWQSLRPPGDASIGPRWLCNFVARYGFDWLEVLAEAMPDFEPVDFEVVQEPESPRPHILAPLNPLTRYSLRDDYREVEQVAGNRSLILDRLLLRGQLAILYGPPGVGKSAILTELTRRDLKGGVLDPERVMYIDLDNNPDGLLDRIRTLKEVGCHVLAEGFRGFSYHKVMPAIERFIKEGHAKDSLVILDTTKKVVDLMEKTAGTEFAKRQRQLTNAGGTLVGLAHTNKHRGADGRPIHAGTTDLLEDFDCAYLLYDIANDPKSNLKTVLFENMKSRGPVAQRKAYQYSTKEGQTYRQLLESIRVVNLQELDDIEHAQHQRDDQRLIDAIIESIQAGTTLKMSIVDRVTKATRSSRRQALDVLDRYCGADQARHLWDFTVGERGGKSFHLLADRVNSDDEH